MRKRLVETSLIGIVSLPSGVFQPYSGVKTSVLILDKKSNKESEYVYYYEVNNDGYTLNANRTPINKNDLPSIVNSFKNNFSKNNLKNFFEIKKNMILENTNFSFNAKNYFQEELKSSYDIKKLSEIIEVKSSKRVLQTEWKNTGIPFYRGREITKLSEYGFVDNEIFIDEKHYDKLEKQYGVPTEDDIVMTAIGTIGNCYIVKKSDKFYFKDASVLWLKRITNSNPKYLKFILKGDGFFNQLDTGLGSTVDTLPINKLKDIKIPLPSIEIQNQIVEELEGYQKIIDGCKQVVENYKPLIDIDQKWEIVELGEIVDVISGQSPPSSSYNLDKKGLPFYQCKTDYGDIYLRDTDNYTSKVTKISKKNDIIMSVRAPVGPVNLNPFEEICIGRGLCAIRPKNEEDLEYIFNYLQADGVVRGHMGATYESINRDEILKIKIPNPDRKNKDKIINLILEERKIIEGNKKIIVKFSEKIFNTINKIWSN